jgi:hypothetical protein
VEISETEFQSQFVAEVTGYRVCVCVNFVSFAPANENLFWFFVVEILLLFSFFFQREREREKMSP